MLGVIKDTEIRMIQIEIIGSSSKTIQYNAAIT